MNVSKAIAAKRLLLTIWLVMLGALAVYAAITYLVPGEPRAQTTQAKIELGVLQVISAFQFLAGIVAERILFRRADSTTAVLLAGIVSAAIGEAIGVFGLACFLMDGLRIWEFFVVSALYFLRLFLRLPEFNARIDSLAS